MVNQVRFDGLLNVAGGGYEIDGSFIRPRKVNGIARPDKAYDPMEPGKLREIYLAFRSLRKRVVASEWGEYDSGFAEAVVSFTNKYGPLKSGHDAINDDRPALDLERWFHALCDIEFAVDVLKSINSGSQGDFKRLVDSRWPYPRFLRPFADGQHIHSRIYNSGYPHRLTPPKPWGTKEIVYDLLREFINGALAEETALTSTLVEGDPLKPAPLSVLGAIYLGFVTVEIASGAPRVCERPGCGNLLPSSHGNTRYCCVQCQERHKKQKQRERKAEPSA